MKTIIETERLYLRELQASDFMGIYNLDADPEVHKFLGNNPIQTVQQAKDVIEFIRAQYVENGIGRLAVIEKSTADFVGWAGFKLIRDTLNGHKDYYDLGYRFLKKSWGKGYATESSKAAVDYAFKVLELPVIYAIADVNNLQSQKVLRKCGFVEKGMFTYESLPHFWMECCKP